ncbi:hypothetical protein [Magnetospirillum fulvum]|uniref:Uncharacterized protein n=1 Tax=Magnetospirillum fulvum TaxID=1082 RepID=A0A1H6GTV7_MAGFU|nr:hypothetical protein [Magnetospirillum fulvum]SEH25580.1 hypothetical protein SAMN04244559_00239 [Magnetospirillum fulvum]
MNEAFSTANTGTAVAIGCLCALILHALGFAAPLLGGATAAALFAVGCRRGAEAVRRQAQAKLFRVADELVQYRAFTRLLRDQGDRIAGTSEEASLAIAAGLAEIDQRIAALMAAHTGTGGQSASFHAEAEAIAQPIIGMLGRLQFQDITQQQIAFLARLSLLLDEHMEELARLLGDRRSLDRTSRFKDLFDRALDDTVMTSQRHDHHAAAGTALFEASGPKIELFGEDEPR